jgi:hypothetical protein
VLKLSKMGEGIQRGTLKDKGMVKAVQRFQITCNIAVVQAYKQAGKSVPPQVQAMIDQGVYKEGGAAKAAAMMPHAGAEVEAHMASGAMSNVRAGADYDKYASSGASGKKKGASMEK